MTLLGAGFCGPPEATAEPALGGFAQHHQIPFLVLAAYRGREDDAYYYQVYKGRITQADSSAKLKWCGAYSARRLLRLRQPEGRAHNRAAW